MWEVEPSHHDRILATKRQIGCVPRHARNLEHQRKNCWFKVRLAPVTCIGSVGPGIHRRLLRSCTHEQRRNAGCQRDGATAIDVRLDGPTVWLSQQQLAELFGSSQQNISHNIRNIFDERELPREGTVKGYLTVRREGTREVQGTVEFYSLDMIISLGFGCHSILASA